MAASAVVTATIDSALERDASEVLADLGLTTSDVLRMTLEKVAHDKALPAAIRRPNATTVAAIEEADRGEGTRYESVDAMFEELGI
jgi:DNA-damage-inducible protein J